MVKNKQNQTEIRWKEYADQSGPICWQEHPRRSHTRGLRIAVLLRQSNPLLQVHGMELPAQESVRTVPESR